MDFKNREEEIRVAIEAQISPRVAIIALRARDERNKRNKEKEQAKQGLLYRLINKLTGR